ncbi:histone H2A deubiquitinase MYSM1 [Planoprotostelium fungivorum]|uniref:Histone H2A deubiquitinase MYSM1 n=1 Tax=Planoprotostelium fungivorum TaxID=1890364 RepID=A0A2P6N2L5_9EUKA|nr:histone H2A deubiquitinase MYSM1 [Planoprotostelium fungivorum]
MAGVEEEVDVDVDGDDSEAVKLDQVWRTDDQSHPVGFFSSDFVDDIWEEYPLEEEWGLEVSNEERNESFHKSSEDFHTRIDSPLHVSKKARTSRTDSPSSTDEYHLKDILESTIIPDTPSKNAKKKKVKKKEENGRESKEGKRATHNIPWTPEEQRLMEEGIEIYGVGKWTDISRHIGSRTTLQVKNHARGYLKKKQVSNMNIIKNRKSSPKKMRSALDVPVEVGVGMESPTKGREHNGEEEEIIVDIGDDEPITSKRGELSFTEKEEKEEGEEREEAIEEETKEVKVEGNSEREEMEETIIMTIETPTKEMILDEHAVTAEEEKYNYEFFSGNLRKTPARYLRIRNGIINVWKTTKPNYLSKTSVRHQLKDCGDVNAIGRVHDYLEACGAINFGAPRPERLSRTREGNNTGSERKRQTIVKQLSITGKGFEVMGKRTRKIRTSEGEWMSKGDYEKKSHKTHDHSVTIDSSEREEKKARKKAKRENYEHSDLTLVPCVPFGEYVGEGYVANYVQPFRVNVASSSMIVMDLHAHTMKTEIIGLLGGRYHEEYKCIDVQMAVPCEGSSTHTQIEARNVLERKGMQVIGWYHSHVTWTPDPSLRDIETQSAWQRLLSISDVQPFVAAILSPYDSTMGTDVSAIQWFWVNHDTPRGTLPMSVHVSDYFSALSDDDIHMMKEIGVKSRGSGSGIDFNSTWRAVDGREWTKMEKLLYSLDNRLSHEMEEEKRSTTDIIKNLF